MWFRKAETTNREQLYGNINNQRYGNISMNSSNDQQQNCRHVDLLNPYYFNFISFSLLRSPFSPLLQNNVVMWFHELLANTEWGRGSVNDLLVECGRNKSVVLHINKTLQTCQLILTLIVGPQYEDLDIGMNPFHFQYLISNSLYCLLYNSHNLNLDNLVLDQLVTP